MLGCTAGFFPLVKCDTARVGAQSDVRVVNNVKCGTTIFAITLRTSCIINSWATLHIDSQGPVLLFRFCMKGPGQERDFVWISPVWIIMLITANQASMSSSCMIVHSESSNAAQWSRRHRPLLIMCIWSSTCRKCVVVVKNLAKWLVLTFNASTMLQVKNHSCSATHALHILVLAKKMSTHQNYWYVHIQHGKLKWNNTCKTCWKHFLLGNLCSCMQCGSNWAPNCNIILTLSNQCKLCSSNPREEGSRSRQWVFKINVSTSRLTSTDKRGDDGDLIVGEQEVCGRPRWKYVNTCSVE